jgi:riboflavin synthase
MCAMFTGIIRHVGTVRAVGTGADSRTLTIDAGPLADETSVGDSISVNGACLTATRVEASTVACDVGAETLRLTTLGALRAGDAVNLELPLRVGDRLGGHFVSGHVDDVGTIRRLERLPGEARLEVEVDRRLSDQMITKGSVAVDGISLTIAALRPGAFEASIIPHTLAATTLIHKRPGDRVNVECDMMGRWVQRLLPGTRVDLAGESLSISELEEQGF